LFYTGLFPVNLNAIFYPSENTIGINSGYVHIINSSFSYWIFTIPVLYCSKRVKSTSDYILLFLVFILAVFSGRRILILPFLFVALFELKYVTKLLSLAFLITLFLNTEIFSSFLDLEIIFKRFTDAISSTGDSEVRAEQQLYFYKYISENPIIGYGLGSYMPDFLRNENFKTAYENTYDYLIFERGIIFGILTMIYFIWLIYKVSVNKLLLKVDTGPIVFASISLLLASFTNPYWLSSFDYAVPLAILMRFAHKPIQ
jgi:hypothetical protein